MRKNTPGTLSYFLTINKSVEKRAQGVNLFLCTLAIYFLDKFVERCFMNDKMSFIIKLWNLKKNPKFPFRALERTTSLQTF